MTKLTSYTCAKCGGVLNIDSDQELFDCPFCGTNFDMVDFHRKDMLSEAELSLKRMEFLSANERYTEMFNKDHNDFEALRGLALCAGKIPSKDDLTSPKRLIKHDMEKTERFIKKNSEYCSVYLYFEKVLEIIGLCREYENLLKIKADVQKVTQLRIRRLGNGNGQYEKTEFAKIAHYEKVTVENTNKKLIDVEAKLSEACLELENLEPSASNAVQYSVNSVNNELSSGTVSNITCIKCGGQLEMDDKRKLCECRSCGVAYGTSLFFGEPNRKAKEALLKKEFNEADQRYSYMLMLDPHDFEALRGRVNCAAKWTGVNYDAEVTSFWVSNVRSRVEYAYDKALDSDKPYFVKYQELVEAYSKVLEQDNKIKPLVKKYKELNVKKSNIVADIEPDENVCLYAHETINKTILDVDKQITPLKKKKKECLEAVKAICHEISDMDKKWLLKNAGLR